MSIIKANSLLIPLKDESVNCCVTSPPYWGLRVYQIPKTVWDGNSWCEHQWGDEQIIKKTGGTQSSTLGEASGGHAISPEHQKLSITKSFVEASQGEFCLLCRAWRGCLGLEPSIEIYIQHIAQVFREVSRVLRPDGTLWLNMGDSYAAGKPRLSEDCQHGGMRWSNQQSFRRDRRIREDDPHKGDTGLKPKDLCMIPSRVAMALQNEGWYLRSMIPWMKKNSMPESTKDRPVTSIEYIFLFSKSQTYFYDYEAVKLPASPDTHARYGRGRSTQHKWADGGPGNQTIAKSFAHMAGKEVSVPDSYHGSVPGRKDGPGQDRRGQYDRMPGVHPKAMPKDAGRDEQGLRTAARMGHGPGWRVKQNESFSESIRDVVDTRMRRVSDWFFESWQGLMSNEESDPLAFVVNSKGYSEAHYATFPENLVEPMILAGCPKSGIVLDPFCGSGTVVKVAERLQRIGIGLDLGYQDLSQKRRQWNQVELCL